MPYIYSLAGMVHFDDYTIMRALVMDFPEDREVTELSDQYMFGPGLMICPVYNYEAREREVWFPKGEGWYDIHTAEFIEGGQQLTVPAPYEEIPIYVRAGSIIPSGPEIQYVDEKPEDPVTLHVYGGADGEFTLYEDEGINYNYEDGAYSKIQIRYLDNSKTMVIGERQGSYEGMQTERVFHVVYMEPDHPQRLDFSATPETSVVYSGNELTIGF